MGVSAISPELSDLWNAGLADAGIDPRDAVLYAFDGDRSTTGYHARSWRRGDRVNEQGDVAAFGDDIEMANGRPQRRLRRVAVWTSQAPEVLAALIRHELEHTRQFEADPEVALDDLYDESLIAMDRAAIDVPRNEDGEVIGGGELYNKIPMEVDANAAASTFVRSYFGEERINQFMATDDRHGALLNSSGPIAVAAIVERMREFVTSGAAEEAAAFAARVNGR